MRNTKGLRPPWHKGQSGNPKGAKKGLRHWNVVFREQFEQGKISQDAIAAMVIRLAKAGNLKAFEIIAERMDSKPQSNFAANTSLELIPPTPALDSSAGSVAQVLCVLEEAGVIPRIAEK